MKILLITTITMMAFAGNSLLCRLALDTYNMNPASFTSIRLISGALTLWLLSMFIKPASEDKSKNNGNWISALALFAYAACFSFAYVNLSTAMGALLLFGAVQATMIGYGFVNGERFSIQQFVGLILAITGFGYLLWPGLTAPPLVASLIMLASGIAWGIYSLRGKGAGDPIIITTGNFIRSIPFTIILCLLSFTVFQKNTIHTETSLLTLSMVIAIISGSMTSGLGYALWYRVLPSLKSTTAATVQLSVPVIAAFAGIIFLNESMSQRLIFSSLAILGGIALVIIKKQQEATKL